MSATILRFAGPTAFAPIPSPNVWRPFKTKVFPTTCGSAMNLKRPFGVATTAVTTGSEVASSSSSNDRSPGRHTKR